MTIRLNLTPLQARVLAHIALNGWGDGDMGEHFTRREAAAGFTALCKLCKAGNIIQPTRHNCDHCTDAPDAWKRLPSDDL